MSTPHNNQYDPNNPYNAPENPALPMFQQLAEQAMGGSIVNYNRAAGRLRERIGGEANRASQTITNQRLAQGLGNSGAMTGDLRDVQLARVGAMGNGLTELEGTFEDSRLRGLESAILSARGISDDHQFGQELLETIRNNLAIDQKDRDLGADRILADLEMNDNTTSSNASQMDWLQNLINSIVGSI